LDGAFDPGTADLLPPSSRFPSDSGSSGELGCDLVIDLTFDSRPSSGGLYGRLGAIRLEIEGLPRGGAREYWLLTARRRVVRLSVERLFAGGQTNTVCEGWTSPHVFSSAATLSRCLGRLSILCRKAVRMLALEPSAAERERLSYAVESRGITASVRSAGRLAAARLCARTVRHFAGRLFRRFVAREQWILILSGQGRRELSAFDPDAGKRIKPPADRDWADPFLLGRDGEAWLFFEEQIVGSPGRISCFRIAASGDHGEPLTVLEKPYHLSYPYVFEHEGELYMVPESGENRSVDLYRCISFPLEWELETTLLPGIPAVDTSLLFRDGLWWLFTNARAGERYSKNEELYLFSSPSLLSGTWRPHPLNPVATDVRSARGAGRIFEEGGRLYRPSQDCSLSYGLAVSVNEIVSLSENDYREEFRVVLSPGRMRGMTALHTFNRLGDLAIIDGKARRFRLAAALRKGKA
jgi:hypothetical protein